MRRLCCLVAAVALALLAGQHAALAYWRTTVSLERTHGIATAVPGLWSANAAIRLQASDRLRADPTALRRQARAVSQAAREVLRHTPLDVLAMRQLGVLASLDDRPASLRLIALAERITRRDLPTEILSIQHVSADGEVAPIIRHYHHALAAYPGAKAQMLPGLVSQLTSPDVRRALALYAAEPWVRELVTDPVEYDSPPAAMIDFYAENASRLPVRDVQQGTAAIVRWLYDYGQYAVLADYVSRLPGIGPGALTAIGFNRVTTDPMLAPLSWTLVSDASVESQTYGTGLQLRIESGLSSVAASRATLLSPGRYDFVVRLGYVPDAPHARLDWNVTCPQSPLEQVLTLSPPAVGSGSLGLQRGTLAIPAGCAVQTWQLRASADEAPMPSEIRITEIALKAR